MKFLLFALISSNVYAMGDPNFNPMKLTPGEYERVNDMGETTSRMGFWSPERGYRDQQMMDENEESIQADIEENKIRDEEIMEKEFEMKEQEQFPYPPPRLNTE